MDVFIQSHWLIVIGVQKVALKGLKSINKTCLPGKMKAWCYQHGVTLPPRPPHYINFFEPFHFTASDQLVVSIGVSHISLPLQEIQSREWEKKEQTNDMLGLTQVQKGSYVTLCMCRLTLAWVSSENSTTLLECWLILTCLPSLLWTSSHPTDLSPVWCWLVTRVTLHQLLPRAPLSNSLLAFPYPLPVTRDLESKTLWLVLRQNRQRNRLLGRPPTQCYNGLLPRLL